MTAPDDYAPECVETHSTTVVIGRVLADAVKFETCIAIWTHASGRTFVPTLRLADDVIAFTDPDRADDAADRLQYVVDELRAKAALTRELTASEANTIALLDGRARTVTV